jgi:RNA polymerase-associated protein CTR9
MNANSQSLSRIAKEVVEDINVHTEIARLWQEDNLDRVGRAYKEAWRLSQATGSGDDPRLLNNLGVLAHLEENFAEARKDYETALVNASGLKSEVGESLATSILYNLARVYEDQGEIGLSKEAYEKLLTRHPEYVDGVFHYVLYQKIVI